MKLLTNVVNILVLEIAGKLGTAPHLLQVEEGDARVEALQEPHLPVLGAGVLLTELTEDSSVVRRHVLGQSEELASFELVKLLIQTIETVFELYVSIDHDKLLEREDEVIEGGDVEEILNKRDDTPPPPSSPLYRAVLLHGLVGPVLLPLNANTEPLSAAVEVFPHDGDGVPEGVGDHANVGKLHPEHLL